MSGIDLSPEEKEVWKIVQAVIQLGRGASNAVGQVTLRANQATTVVDKSVSPGAINVAQDQTITYTPMTANAAAEVGNGTIYISAVDQQSFTITHANNAQTDRIYAWSAKG